MRNAQSSRTRTNIPGRVSGVRSDRRDRNLRRNDRARSKDAEKRSAQSAEKACDSTGGAVFTKEDIIKAAAFNFVLAERLVQLGKLEAEQNEAINRHEAELRRVNARWEQLKKLCAIMLFALLLAIGLWVSKFLAG